MAIVSVLMQKNMCIMASYDKNFKLLQFRLLSLLFNSGTNYNCLEVSVFCFDTKGLVVVPTDMQAEIQALNHDCVRSALFSMCV
jgi:hypothetical protein